MAPEVFDRKYTEKADNWSCGAVMYQLYCGAPPFIGKTPTEIKNKIKNTNIKFGIKLFLFFKYGSFLF